MSKKREKKSRAKTIPHVEIFLYEHASKNIIALSFFRSDHTRFLSSVPQAILAFLDSIGWKAVLSEEEFKCQACGGTGCKKLDDPTFLCEGCRLKACTPHRLLNKPLSEEKKRQLLEEPEILDILEYGLPTKKAGILGQVKQAFKNFWRRLRMGWSGVKGGSMVSGDCIRDRFKKSLDWLYAVMVLLSGSVGLLFVIALFMPIRQMIATTHGLVGFIFGIVFIVGSAISNWIFWLITGKSAFCRIFFGHWKFPF